MKTLVLLDAHAILHRAYHALPDFSTSKGQPTGALYGISTMLIKIIEDLKPDYMMACYDMAKPTYRHIAFKDYKAGRKKAEDDLIEQMQTSRQIFETMNIPIYEKEGFEADDILGTIVNKVLPSDLNIIIASGDMDTLQLVNDDRVRVYTLKKGIKDTVIYNEKAVMERFGFGPELIPDYKGLRGDPSDNIPGIKGIGEKTATILIKEFGTIENIYKALNSTVDKKNAKKSSPDEAFLKVGITPRIIELLRANEEEALFSKMLATIRKDAPINFVIPEKSIKDSLDVKKVNDFWHSLEFRTLGQRLDTVYKKVYLGIKSASNITNNSSEGFITTVHNMNAGSDSKSISLTTEQNISANKNASNSIYSQNLFENNNIDPILLKKAGIALWLINSTITDPKLEDILAFANTDDFNKASEFIMEELKKLKLERVFDEIEIPIMPVIEAMQNRGVKIDKAKLVALSKEYTKTVSELEKKIWKMAGKEFNISSPKQLGEILFDVLGLKPKNAKKTAGGARSTKESELEKMRDMHPIVPLIFEYRELTKLLSTYIDAIPPLLDNKDRLHAKFIQTGTTTGRMASQEPNLQNIPIKTDLGKAIRTAFIAEKGYKLCTLDYSQVELRIGAFLSGDKRLIEIFKNGEDVHTSVASFVFKVPKDKVTSEMRRHAKTINFGIMYGMGVLALKQGLGTSKEEAQTFMDKYFTSFSGLASYLDKVKLETAKNGYTETFFGRRRYFEGIRSKIPYIRASAERMAINAPIQGTGADIVKLAMSKVWEYCNREGLQKDVFPLIQVHDELVFEIKEEKVEKILPKIKEIMESVIDIKDTKGVPLVVSSASGNNWGELK